MEINKIKFMNLSNKLELLNSSKLKNDNYKEVLNSKTNDVLLVENYHVDDESAASEEVKNVFECYDLSDDQVLKLSRLCIQEQGSVKGAAAEASLMANLFELRGGEYKGLTGAEGLYSFVRNSGWFYKASEYMDNGSKENKANQEVIDAVESVLVDGKRILPKYINEHDTIYDLESVTNNGEIINKSNPSEYIPNISKCKQDSNSFDDPITWTYYCHPDKGCDPFGYDNEELREKYGDSHYDFDTGEYVEK